MDRRSERGVIAAELVHFSNCVLTGQHPAPCGHEGLAEVRIIEALYESAEHCQPVALACLDCSSRPTLEQELKRPAASRPELVPTQTPSL